MKATIEGEIKKIKDQGFKVFFESVGDTAVEKISTICIIEEKENQILNSVGISICSLRDVYSKQYGKNQAFWRAVLAFNNKMTSLPIDDMRTDWLGKYITRTKKVKDQSDIDNVVFDLKWAYDKIFVPGFFDSRNDIIKTYNNKIIYKVPLNYCLMVTARTYGWKSQYFG